MFPKSCDFAQKVRHLKCDGNALCFGAILEVQQSRKSANTRKIGRPKIKVFSGTNKNRSSDDYGFLSPFRGPFFQVFDGNAIFVAGRFCFSDFDMFWGENV